MALDDLHRTVIERIETDEIKTNHDDYLSKNLSIAHSALCLIDPLLRDVGLECGSDFHWR